MERRGRLRSLQVSAQRNAVVGLDRILYHPHMPDQSRANGAANRAWGEDHPGGLIVLAFGPHATKMDPLHVFAAYNQCIDPQRRRKFFAPENVEHLNLFSDPLSAIVLPLLSRPLGYNLVPVVTQKIKKDPGKYRLTSERVHQISEQSTSKVEKMIAERALGRTYFLAPEGTRSFDGILASVGRGFKGFMHVLPDGSLIVPVGVHFPETDYVAENMHDGFHFGKRVEVNIGLGFETPARAEDVMRAIALEIPPAYRGQWG